jgi:hypothetical protein
MRVLLDSGRTQVDIEVENGTAKFLEVLVRALKAMDYSEVDLVREFKENTKPKDEE